MSTEKPESQPQPESPTPLIPENWRKWDLEECREWMKEEFDEAFERYRNGREEYGPTFVGDTLKQLQQELMDAAFYRWNSEKERTELREKLAEAQEEIRRLEKLLKAS